MTTSSTPKNGFIDIVCNLFDPMAVEQGHTGLDDDFKDQIRMDPLVRDGVPIPDYIQKNGSGRN